MGRKKKAEHVTECEPILVRCTHPVTGYPVSLSVVRAGYKEAMPSPWIGWFWIFATPRAARDIRRRGLHAIGTACVTFAPPQRGVTVDLSVTPDDVPVIGTQEHAAAMHVETMAAANDTWAPSPMPPDFSAD